MKYLTPLLQFFLFLAIIVGIYFVYESARIIPDPINTPIATPYHTPLGPCDEHDCSIGK